MTVTYRAEGRLTNPVTDLQAARAYLDEPMETFLCWDDQVDLRAAVHTIRWDLISVSTWQVMVVTNQALDADQLTRLSEWISGQNSDGLGEGFEQQPFAEHEGEDDDDDWEMSSFDWGDNPCTLRVVPQ